MGYSLVIDSEKSDGRLKQKAILDEANLVSLFWGISGSLVCGKKRSRRARLSAMSVDALG
jgi:hypothetical protein